jgi:hypothetical protein
MKTIIFTCTIVALLCLSNLVHSQDIISDGSNKWIFHTPDDGRTSLYIAPWTNNDWGWGSQIRFDNDGKATFNGVEVVNSRKYIINRLIAGYTEDAQGVNYLLLHKIYTSGSPIDDYHVIGKITGIRGGTGSWNRKWTVEVNTASAYNGNRGSIISFNEGAKLVTLTYGNAKYLAIEIVNSSTLYDFSFTGYASNESFKIVYDQDVADVQTFTSLDPITIQGNVGIGTSTPQNTLDVNGTIRAKEVKVESGWADFVFKPDYQLKPLAEVEQFISTNGHLPEIPTTKEVEQNGVNLGEMNAKLLQKVEELTLYLIEQKKIIEKQQQQITKMNTEIQTLKDK